MLKPPRVDDALGSPNAVQTSQILEQSMDMHTRLYWMSLFMVIKFLKLIMTCNICMVTFMEIAYGEITLLA